MPFKSISHEQESINTHIGTMLRKRRQKVGLSQSDLATRLNISYQQLQKYERGENTISSSRLYQVARELRVSINYFYSEIDTTASSNTFGNPILLERSLPLNILLIEDDPTDQMLTNNALNLCPLDNNLYTIQDGKRAIQFLRGHSDETIPRPDIILLDLNIPKYDGFELLKEMKRDRSLMHIPVIVLTNSINPEHMLRCYKNHASGYICKSFDVSIFIRHINNVVGYWAQTCVLPSMINYATEGNEK